MATIVPQTTNSAGVEPTYNVAAVGGDTITGNDGNLQLTYVNGHSSSQTVTFTPVRTERGETIAPRAVVIPNAKSRTIKLDPGVFGESVAATYSGVTLLTFSAIK